MYIILNMDNTDVTRKHISVLAIFGTIFNKFVIITGITSPPSG
jgi:hypothetical protein